MALLHYDFMQRALVAAVMVGLAAPRIGVFLVQRRLSLIGDGIGHIALTGVALGLLTGRAPLLVALVVSIIGAASVELLRTRGRTGGDLALAVMFYGGIAGGVVLIGFAPGATVATLNSYLFGAITTTSTGDLVVFAALTLAIVALTGIFAQQLFAISNDEEFARASGMPVNALNLMLACLTASTVVLSMRVVGLLLISALMIVPVATAQLVSASFRSTTVLAVIVAVICAVGGVVVSFYADAPSGGSIVLLAILVFALTALGTSLRRALPRRAVAPDPG